MFCSSFSQNGNQKQKKGRNRKANLVATGGGSYTCKELTSTENRLLDAIGWVTVCGNDELPE